MTCDFKSTGRAHAGKDSRFLDTITEAHYDATIKEEITFVIGTFRQILSRPMYDWVGQAAADNDNVLDLFPPECNSNRRGYPHFYRLITRNLIGLYQIKSLENAVLYEKWFKRYLSSGAESDAPPDVILKGGLALSELNVFGCYLERICANYRTLKENVA